VRTLLVLDSDDQARRAPVPPPPYEPRPTPKPTDLPPKHPNPPHIQTPSAKIHRHRHRETHTPTHSPPTTPDRSAHPTQRPKRSQAQTPHINYEHSSAAPTAPPSTPPPPNLTTTIHQPLPTATLCTVPPPDTPHTEPPLKHYRGCQTDHEIPLHGAQSATSGATPYATRQT
jgi:hypothetical protein